MSAEPEMLKLPEAGAELGISRWLAYELYSRGEFPVPVLKLGRCLRVSRTMLRRYIETGTPLPAGDPRHGTNGYTNIGCRCEVCRKAHSDWVREYNHRTGRRRPRGEYLASLPAPTHGLRGTYTRRGCRCAECRAAAAAYARSRRAAVRGTLPADDPRHGRPSTYLNWSCRCPACSEAYSVSRRRRVAS